MAKTQPWKKIVKKALRGGPWTNAQVYKRVATEIGSKELTTNQKAKVRQQMQSLGEHPTGVKRGAYRLSVKLPPANSVSQAVGHASNLGFLSNPEIGEREKDEKYHKNSRLFVHEFDVTDDIYPKELIPFAKELERLYGENDTAIHFLFEFQNATTGEITGEQWVTISYGNRPMIAVEHLPGAIQKIEKKSEGIYVLHHVKKLSFLVFVPV